LTVDNTTEVKQYLLGTLTSDEKARLEEKYFTDDELFEQIEIVEDELIDAYIRGELAPDEATHFQKHLAASERLAERVAFAQTLAKSTQRTAETTSTSQQKREPFWRSLFFPTTHGSLRWAPIASLVVLVLGAGLLVFQFIRIRQELQRLHERAQIEQRNQLASQELSQRNSELSVQLAEARAENERLANELASARKETPQDNEPKSFPAAFFLSPGALRSSGKTNLVRVSSERPTVRLDLGLDAADYSSYQATIKNIDGNEVWTKSDLRVLTRGAGKVVQFSVPTSRLTNGFYSIELSGRSSSEPLQRAGTYSFRVERK
jgi:putative zinc finger protein